MPVPNKHGVYDKDEAENIRFATKTKKGWCSALASAQINFMEVNGHWISGLDYEFNCGDHQGCHSPMWGEHKTREDAINPHITVLINFLVAKIERGLTGCASIEQIDQAKILLNQVRQYAGLETSGQTSMFGIGD